MISQLFKINLSMHLTLWITNETNLQSLLLLNASKINHYWFLYPSYHYNKFWTMFTFLKSFKLLKIISILSAKDSPNLISYFTSETFHLCYSKLLNSLIFRSFCFFLSLFAFPSWKYEKIGNKNHFLTHDEKQNIKVLR